MQLNPRRAIITLLWVGSLVVAGPAIGLAQSASERLSAQSVASDHRTSASEYAPATAGTHDDAAKDASQHFWMLDD